jgi:hypothetical protein
MVILFARSVQPLPYRVDHLNEESYVLFDDATIGIRLAEGVAG